MKKIVSNSLLAVVLCTAISCANDSTTTETKDTTTTTNTAVVDGATPTDATPPATTSQNVVETAIASPNHSTLVAAVKAAGLVETLSGAGPFTVFAPTNAAFEKLPAGTVDGLLKPEKKADLTKILTYHVVPGSLKAADLKDGQKLKTVEGNELTVSVKDGKVMIDGANVSTADLVASNGVIHVLDAVVMPKK